MDLEWKNPGNKEIATIAAFISSESQDIHDGFGGPSHFDTNHAKFVQLQPYAQLDSALKIYVPQYLGIHYNGDSWEGLSDQIIQAEKRFNDSNGGTWHSIWYKMGNYKETLDGWVALIPDAYGLAVVKTGLAVVFKLAEHSAERRNLIFKVFTGLRDALTEADPARTSFRANRNVRDCANSLYQAIVDSIEDMILLTAKEKSAWRRIIPRFKQKTPSLDPDTILKNVEEHTKKFQLAVRSARDQAIEGTAIVAQYAGMKSVLVHRDVNATKHNTEILITDLEKHGTKLETLTTKIHADSTVLRKEINANAAYRERESDQNIARFRELHRLITKESVRRNEIAERENRLQHHILYLENKLFELLMENKKNNAILMPTCQFHHPPKSYAMVTEDRFCQILAQSTSASGAPPNLDHIIQHPNNDLRRAFMQKGRFKISVQGQVQSLLRHNRFIYWLNRNHSDLILVDANIRSAGLENLSVISVFCATLVTSTIKIRSDDVVTYFFCGLHTAPRDPWHGPNGLVRSINVQLLMKLMEMESLHLNFIDNRDNLMALEEHDLHSLCSTLHSLVSQFPRGMRVYCIIDSISCFDKDKLFDDLKFVMNYLEYIVNDEELIPIFKVLVTNPRQSTRRIKELRVFMDDPSKLINLSLNNSIPMEISNRGIETYLLRPSTPTPPMPKREAYTTINQGIYDDNDDKGWQTE